MSDLERKNTRLWALRTKLLIREVGRSQVKLWIEKLSDEINYQEKDGEVVKDPVTKVEKEMGETLEEILDEVLESE